MSVSLRRLGGRGLATAPLLALGILAAQAQAQVRPIPVRVPPNTSVASANLARINPNWQFAPGVSLPQVAFNTAVMGRAIAQIPPYALGYNPYPQVISTGPVYPSYSPYGLSTGYNPYALTGYGGGGYGGYGGYGTLATDPYGGYGLSTVPGGLGAAGAYGANPYLNGAAYNPEAAGLYGIAALTAANGQFYKDIESARITREQSRQMAIETRRRLRQEEAEIERMRFKAIDMIERERATDLAMARHHASDASIWSGKALNELLRAIGDRKLNTGPPVTLDGGTLENVNLARKGFKGDVALLKALLKTEKLPWPAALKEGKFDEARDNFDAKLSFAVRKLKLGEPVREPTIRDLNAYLKTLEAELGATAELSPSRYIEADRFLKRLREAVRALEQPDVNKAFNGDWVARGKNVAELVENMQREGLQFAPTSPGAEGAYNSLYQALRAFDAGLPAAKGSSARLP
jgi:hypothetical protein